MTFAIQESPQGPVSVVTFDGDEPRTTGEFVDVIMSAPTPTLVIDRSSIPPAFFDLKTGFAGEVLQKVSTYRRRLVILGKFDAVESPSLRAFIAESNRSGRVIFAADFDRGVALLQD